MDQADNQIWDQRQAHTSSCLAPCPICSPAYRAFRTAAAIALRDRVTKAGPIILEPIMRVEVVAPEDCTGNVIGDLSIRSGTIIGIGPRANGLHDITAHVPLAVLFGYATSLRSRTQGRGTFSMEFDYYAQVPAETAQELMRRCA